MRVYRSVTELELTSGSATIAGAWAAMNAGETLIVNVQEFASGERPNNYGSVEILKQQSDRGKILFWAKEADTSDYRMFLNNSGVPGGTWTALPKQIETGQESFTVGAGAYVDKDVAFTRSFSST